MAEGDLTTQPDIIEDNKDANAIASMLWVWKWVNRNSVSAGTIDNPITIKLADGDTNTSIGSFLVPRIVDWTFIATEFIPVDADVVTVASAVIPRPRDSFAISNRCTSAVP